MREGCPCQNHGVKLPYGRLDPYASPSLHKTPLDFRFGSDSDSAAHPNHAPVLGGDERSPKARNSPALAGGRTVADTGNTVAKKRRVGPPLGPVKRNAFLGNPTKTFKQPLDKSNPHPTYRAMEPFLLTEEKALVFHRAVLSVAREHGNLLVRAREELVGLRTSKPAQGDLWDRWAALLDMGIDAMSEPVLANTPDGGLLRAHSPFGQSLSKEERNAVWQRIGLAQFIGYFHNAANDLDLSAGERAMLTGIEAALLTEWAQLPPVELQKGELDKLKQVVSLHSALKNLSDDADVRRKWLRSTSETLAGVPLALMIAGDIERVMEHLVGAAQLTLGPDRYPKM